MNIWFKISVFLLFIEVQTEYFTVEKLQLHKKAGMEGIKRILLIDKAVWLVIWSVWFRAENKEETEEKSKNTKGSQANTISSTTSPAFPVTYNVQAA